MGSDAVIGRRMDPIRTSGRKVSPPSVRWTATAASTAGLGPSKDGKKPSPVCLIHLTAALGDRLAHQLVVAG